MTSTLISVPINYLIDWCRTKFTSSGNVYLHEFVRLLCATILLDCNCQFLFNVVPSILWNYTVAVRHLIRNYATQSKSGAVHYCLLVASTCFQLIFQIKSIGATVCFCLSWITAFVMLKCFPLVVMWIGVHGCIYFFATCCFLGKIIFGEEEVGEAKILFLNQVPFSSLSFYPKRRVEASKTYQEFWQINKIIFLFNKATFIFI